LLLNVVAATYSTWLFSRGRVVNWTLLRPLLFASVPTALVGGLIILNAHIYKTFTGLALLLAAAILILRRAHDKEPDRPTPLWGAISVGAGVGFVSGLTGVGGGVFLAPLLIALHWASPKQTAALSAPFILANSAVGFAGASYAGQVPTTDTWLDALAALAGAIIGATVGMRGLSQTMTRYALAAILGVAGIQLLLSKAGASALAPSHPGWSRLKIMAVPFA
jgi:uncharacterized membrane protein YfcA